MEKLTHQQMFDKALEGVLSNKDGLSYNEGFMGNGKPMCLYNKPNGDGCNAAYIAGEDRQFLEEGGWDSINNLKIFHKHVGQEEIKYIRPIQRVHDCVITHFQDAGKVIQIEKYKENMKKYAAENGLVCNL